jgi:hypothetical protein
MIRAIVTPIFFLAACNCVHADERQIVLAEGKVSRKPQVVFLKKPKRTETTSRKTSSKKQYI